MLFPGLYYTYIDTYTWIFPCQLLYVSFGLCIFYVHVYVGIPKFTHPHRRMEIIFFACNFGVIKHYRTRNILIQRGGLFFFENCECFGITGAIKLKLFTFYMFFMSTILPVGGFGFLLDFIIGKIYLCRIISLNGSWGSGMLGFFE